MWSELSLCSAVSGEDRQHYDLHIIGGYQDERGTSLSITNTLLDLLITSQSVFRLVAAVIGELNTEHRAGLAWPRVYGGGVDLRTGEVFSATFRYHGPDPDIRFTIQCSQWTAGITDTLLGLSSAREWKLFIIFMIPTQMRSFCSTTTTASSRGQSSGSNRLISSYWATSPPVLLWSPLTSVIIWGSEVSQWGTEELTVCLTGKLSGEWSQIPGL